MKRISSQIEQLDRDRLYYDYTHQAWIRGGVYQDCSHPANTCDCYGRSHAGQQPAADAEIH